MTAGSRPANWSDENAAAFQLEGVVEHYHLRAPYPLTLIPCLRELATPPGGPVLELGCGTGEIARGLAPHVERIDAIDVSARMIEKARRMAGGDHPAIQWVVGRAEDAALGGPYAIAVAGRSLHWMEWEAVLPHASRHLAPGAVLAIVVGSDAPPPWQEELSQLIARYSAIQNWQTPDLIGILEARGLFRCLGEKQLNAERYSRTVDEYIDGQHATSALARERMGEANVRAFDDALRALVAPHARNGVLQLSASGEVKWGTPLASTTQYL